MRRLVLVAALFVATLAATPARAAPESNLVIQPGRAIGNVRVGMTFAQVRAVLGRPNVVNKRTRAGFGRYVEYDWGWGNWTVGFSGRASNLRVSLIGTTLRRERTRDGVGVGVSAERMRRVLRDDGLNCSRMPADTKTEIAHPVCRLGTRVRGLTFFQTDTECTDLDAYNCPPRKRRTYVSQVVIVTAAAPIPKEL
jgi:hypothetical protein